jgi:AhpD family alkylhydroperoxidase
MGANQQLLDDLVVANRALRRAYPGPWRAFRDLHAASMSDGALDARTKELMALAIAVAKQCDGCIAHHARAAAREGATPAEVAEALGVALLMAGGPATTYGPRAWAAYQEFAGAAVTEAVAS